MPYTRKGIAKQHIDKSSGRCSQRGGDMRRTLKVLREVQLDVSIKKVDIYKGVTVKALLDSSATGMFMDRKVAAKYRFRLQKLERLLKVRNVNESDNSVGAITHKVEVNMYFKNHVERMRMDMCDLGRIEVILGMPWLQAHNPEINQETGEVRMTRQPPLCGRNLKIKEKKEVGKS